MLRRRAPRRQSVGSKIGDRKGSLGTDSEKGVETPSSFDSGNQRAGPARLTLESLRAEIESELAAGGTQTAYDGKFAESLSREQVDLRRIAKSKIINKAIQDIGMVRSSSLKLHNSVNSC